MSKIFARIYIAFVVALLLLPLFYAMRWIWFGQSFPQELIDRMMISSLLSAVLGIPLPFVIEVFDE